MEGVRRQPVDRQLRSLRIGRGQLLPAAVIHRAVFLQQLRLSISHIVRMGEAEVDQEGSGVLLLFPPGEVVEHLVGVPGAAAGIGTAALHRIPPYREQRVGTLVAVAGLAGSHGSVARLVEDGRQGKAMRVRTCRLLGLLSLPAFLSSLFSTRLQAPERAAAHDHAPRRGTDRPGEGAHVVGAIENHPPLGQLVEDRRLEPGGRVVGLEIKGRLVIGDDEENVGALIGGPGHRCGGKRHHEQCRAYFHGTDHCFLPGWDWRVKASSSSVFLVSSASSCLVSL